MVEENDNNEGELEEFSDCIESMDKGAQKEGEHSGTTHPKMQFQFQQQMVTLKRLVGGAIHIASKKQVAKMSFVGGKVLVLCF